MSKIFAPYRFEAADKEAKNRIALAPMTNMQSHADGHLSKEEHRFLLRRAEEGFGIIITCASHVSLDGQGWPGQMGIFSDELLPGLQALAADLRAAGALSLVQIYHGGARSPQELTGKQPWSASAHSITGAKGEELAVREASEADILQCIEDFVAAAHRAHAAGFDGVELHAAHGYLLQQFISKTINTRNDAWGGSFEKRCKLLLTIAERIRQELPRSFLLAVRLSPESKYHYQGIDFDESLALAEILADMGCDCIHVSPWDAFKKPEQYPDSPPIIEQFARRLKGKCPTMVAGLVMQGEQAEQVLDMGCDFVALGRAALACANWPNLVRQGKQIPEAPYSAEQLLAGDMSPIFVEYMRRWKGFVREE